MDKTKIGEKILESYKSREGIFKEVDRFETSEEIKKSEFYLDYITFVSAIDYQKNIDADKLWEAGEKWAKDYPWLFKPAELLNKQTSEIANTFKQITDYKFFKPQDVYIWLLIADALYKHGGNTKTLLEEFEYDAYKIYTTLSGNLKKDFPFLSGPKILPMWLRILKEDAGIELKNMEKIPLPVDKNVARVTCNLIFGEKFDGKVEEIKEKVRKEWNDIAKELGLPVIKFDYPLWFLGSKGCSKRKCGYCSFRDDCKSDNAILPRQSQYL
ncbi:MAG: N-glycosylase/DNA lyase [Candidatus Hydrothermarchaeota archaeon]|nr:N-glycosylase/DNA lyase [Candidatus Hydrothermarchaeota archaeon]